MGLAQRLRDGTWPLHGQTERAGIMPALLRGTLPKAGFVALQRNLQALYATLEPALARHQAHPALAPLALPGLPRLQHLADDLAVLHGPGWASDLPVLRALQAYQQRLGHLAEHRPALLAAHAYVRYLGDLSGGQALRRLVVRAYGLAGEAGSRFFDFGPPAQVAALAQAFRTGLDQLPAATEQESQALVDEACWGFAQHARVFEALAAAGHAPPAADTSAPPVTTVQHPGHGQT